MKYSEREKLVNDLTALLDFLKSPQALLLPKPRINIETWMHVPAGDVAKMARVARAMKPCTKNVNDWSFELERKFGDINLRYWTGRDNVCTKVKTGTETVEEKKYVTTGNLIVQDTYEWECPPSLLADNS
jgi:hypothetical protein